MIKENPMRVYRITVLVVSFLSLTIGFLVGDLTGQYTAVYLVQIAIAILLSLWYPYAKKQQKSAADR